MELRHLRYFVRTVELGSIGRAAPDLGVVQSALSQEINRLEGERSVLVIHLGVVMALFLTLPYGKLAHGVYRVASLLKFAIEKRLPSRLQLGSD